MSSGGSEFRQRRGFNDTGSSGGGRIPPTAGNGNDVLATIDRMPGVIEVATNVGKGFVRKYPTVTALWVLGLLLTALVGGLQPDVAQLKEYNSNMMQSHEVENRPGGLYDLQQEYAMALQDVRDAKTWWLWPSESQRNWYDQMQEKAYSVEARLVDVKRERDEVVGEAKKAVGIFSSFGVSESRSLFWDSFEQGKAFARRMTMYDALFGGIRMATSRDEEGAGLLKFLLQMLFRLIINFTIGLVGALFYFVASLWGVVSSFQPDILSGTIFFSLVTLAAVATTAAFLVGMYGAAAGTVYVGVKQVARAAALENERRRALGAGGAGGGAGGGGGGGGGGFGNFGAANRRYR